MAMAKKLPPVHPGEVLREEFLRPMNLTPYAVARAIGVPRTRIERLAHERTAVTADTALRLARYFGTSPTFWLGIQTQYDLERARLRRRGSGDAHPCDERLHEFPDRYVSRYWQRTPTLALRLEGLLYPPLSSLSNLILPTERVRD